MTRVSTETTSLQVAREDSPGVLTSTDWRQLEPDNISSFGAEITTTPRRPISKNRQNQQGITTDLDASVEFDTDVTMSSMFEFADGFTYSRYVNFDLVFREAPVLTTGFTVPALSVPQAAKMQWVTAEEATLLFARNYATAVNNGIFALTAQPTDTDVLIPVGSQGLVVEAVPPTTALLEVAGVRPSTSDLALTVSGSTATLVSTDITDWASLGLVAGMWIHIGGLLTANQFSTSGSDFARVVSFAGGTLNLDKIGPLLATDSGAGDTVDIMFGQFCRNVAVDAVAADEFFVEQDYQFEVAYPRSAVADLYEYTIGCRCNEMAVSLPQTDKATMTLGFVGINADDVTESRKSGADSGVIPTRRTAFGTSSNIANLRTSAIATGDQVCFKSLTLTLNNNAAPEKCLGTLGAVATNTGIFDVTVEAQAWFTGEEITNAIKNNTVITMDFALRNTDGAIVVDIPSMTLGGGGREFPRDQTVLINSTGTAFEDPLLATSIGISLFPAVPLT